MNNEISMWLAICFGYGTLFFTILITLRISQGRNKLFDFSGLEFIYRKFVPYDEKTLPTGVLWVIGIYVALFGIASQRYENKVDLLEYRYTAFLTTVAAGSPFVGSKLQVLENETCPFKPDILNPVTVFRSIFLPENQYAEFNGLLVRTIEEWKMKLSGADLTKADLKGVDLSGAELGGAKLSGANLSGANLSWANLSNARLTGVNLQGADLRGADLSKADMNRTVLITTVLIQKNHLKDEAGNRIISKTKIEESDFGVANLSGAILSSAKLEGAMLQGVNFSNAVFLKANLSGAILNEAKLAGAKLIWADLSWANLSEANLNGAVLVSANLNEAVLHHTKVSFNQLLEARTLFNAEGINKKVLSRLRLIKPSLLDPPRTFGPKAEPGQAGGPGVKNN